MYMYITVRSLDALTEERGKTLRKDKQHFFLVQLIPCNYKLADQQKTGTKNRI